MSLTHLFSDNVSILTRFQEVSDTDEWRSPTGEYEGNLQAE